MPKRELFDAEFSFVAETDKAILVTEDGGKTEVWLPKSQIEYTLGANDMVSVTMPLWLASEKGFAGA